MEPLIQKLGITKEEAEILGSIPKRNIGRLYQEQNRLDVSTTRRHIDTLTYSENYPDYGDKYQAHQDVYYEYHDHSEYNDDIDDDE